MLPDQTPTRAQAAHSATSAIPPSATICFHPPHPLFPKILVLWTSGFLKRDTIYILSSTQSIAAHLLLQEPMAKECAGCPYSHRLQPTVLQTHRLQHSRLRVYTVQPVLCEYTICSVVCSHCAAQHAACSHCAVQHTACSQAAAQHTAHSHCAAARSRGPLCIHLPWVPDLTLVDYH